MIWHEPDSFVKKNAKTPLYVKSSCEAHCTKEVRSNHGQIYQIYTVYFYVVKYHLNQGNAARAQAIYKNRTLTKDNCCDLQFSLIFFLRPEFLIFFFEVSSTPGGQKFSDNILAPQTDRLKLLGTCAYG